MIMILLALCIPALSSFELVDRTQLRVACTCRKGCG
jgi:hypothetical protein